MELFWLLVGIVFSLNCYFWCRYWYRRPKTFPPGPRGIPVLGALPFLGKNAGKTIKTWSKNYGPIMSVRMGSEDQVFLNNYDVIYQAFVKQGRVFSGRPRNEFLQQISSGKGLGFVDNDEKWKSQRKFGMKTLRGFGFERKGMESKTLEEVECLVERIQLFNGKAFDITPVLKNAALNTICSIIMGKRFEYDDPQFKEMGKRMMKRFAEPVYNVVILSLVVEPKLRHFPPFSYYNKLFLEDCKIVYRVIKDVVKEHEDSFDGKEIRDFIDAFIKEKRKGEDQHFSGDQVLHYSYDLLSAGTETTAVVLTWSILCCLHYPQAQTKLRKEIMEKFGPEGQISITKRKEMPYANAFIQELYRFRTLVPFGIQRKTIEDTKLGDYVLSKGTTVSPNIWAVHNDANLWDEPEKFKPERFLDEKGNLLSSNHVIPFSIGPRNCLGDQVARMEVFMYIVGMIQKFEFLPDPSADQLPDIEKASIGLLYVPLPYKVVARQL